MPTSSQLPPLPTLMVTVVRSWWCQSVTSLTGKLEGGVDMWLFLCLGEEVVMPLMAMRS